MYKLSTAQWRLATVLLSTFVAGRALGQALPPAALTADWRHIGNFTVELGLAGPASGPVRRVWYGTGGALFAQTEPGRVYQTTDLENWQRTTAAAPPAIVNSKAQSLPEAGALTRALAGNDGRVYAFGNFVYRSDDGGAHWENMTAYRGVSLVGSVVDLVIAPGNSDEIVTAGAAGVFRSVDGGRSWSALNQGLPNLPRDAAARSSG